MAVSLASFRARFINVKDTEELKAAVNEIIPLKENQFKIINVQGSVKKFKATIECKIESEKEFIESYQQKSTETVRKLTPKYPGEKSMYRKCVYFRCHHNTRYQATMNSKEKALKNPSHRFKNTDCPFSMVIKFKRIGEDDDAIVELEWTHNHPIKSLQTLSFRDIREDISAEIFNLFENNFTPGLAYREFSRKAKENWPSEIEFHKQISDRSVFPRRTDYNYLYTEYHRSKFGTKCTDTMFQKLNTLVVEKTLADPETTLKFQKFSSVENDPFILVIITPLMKRVHEKVRSSGEMVFFDSSGGMEEYNLRVFVMVTHSFVGALPLGIVVTSDETTDTLTRALEMFSSSLPDFAFYGKGALNGPGVIMTDNCDELKDALHATWPRSRLLLCIFHLMQQVWRWLFDKKHGILQADRPAIMMKFRKIVYSDIEEQTDEFFNDLLEDCRDVYPKLKSYLITLFEIKERWCMCFRNNLMLRGNNTNNYVEAQFLVLKDNILNRTKEVNINGLLEKLTKDFNNHYKLKLLSVANGRFDGIYSRRFMGKSKGSEGVGFKLPSESVLVTLSAKIVHSNTSIFIVPSFTDPSIQYCVDTELGICECHVGKDGSPCKHQYIAWRKFGKASNFIPYLSAEKRKECSYIAIGETLPDSYYLGLRDFVFEQPQTEQNERSTTEIGTEVDQLDQGFPQDTVEDELDNPVNSIEKLTVGECKREMTETSKVIADLLDKHSENQELLKGVSKFCDRIKRYENQPSKLISAFHNFGTDTHYRKKVTNTTLLKKRLGKKIKVQPEAVKRRKVKNGSKSSIQKGMTKRKNPFEQTETSVMRAHSFATNVKDNEAVSKKAGRTMTSKTKFLHPRKEKLLKMKHDL